MIQLKDIAYYVTDKISSSDIQLNEYITTDSILPNKQGRTLATNLPPQKCTLTKYVKGDVLIANIRPYLKKIWLADSDGGASNDVLVFRAKEEYNSDFVFAVLLQNSFYDWVMKAPKGTQMPRGDRNHIMRYKITDLGEDWKDVGKFARLLDGKISLNRSISSNLRKLVRQLYDYWFVQFDFPDKSGQPYKTSGGDMEFNEQLQRNIPKGWTVKRLKDCIVHINTGLNPRDNFKFGGNIRYITVKNLTTEGVLDLSGCDTIDEEARAKVHSRSQIAIGDILFASICPLGRAYLITSDPVDWDINESVFSIRPNTKIISSVYLNLLLTDEYYIKRFTQISTGSIFQGIRIGELEDVYIVVPDFGLMERFSSQVMPWIQEQRVMAEEISSLIYQRDEILPLLMNGQVQVYRKY